MASTEIKYTWLKALMAKHFKPLAENTGEYLWDIGIEKKKKSGKKYLL